MVVVSYDPLCFCGVSCKLLFRFWFIWVLSRFFLMSLAKSLSMLLVFAKNQLLVSFIFSIVIFVCISFFARPSLLLSSPPSTNTGLFVLFPSPSGVRSVWDFSCSSRQACLAIHFPLRTAFTASCYFGTSCFHVHSSRPFLCHWFPHWATGCSVSMCLFSLYVFVFFPRFPCYWFLVSHCCVLKRCWIGFQSLIYRDLLCGLTWSILQNVPCALKYYIFCCFWIGYSVYIY